MDFPDPMSPTAGDMGHPGFTHPDFAGVEGRHLE